MFKSSVYQDKICLSLQGSISFINWTILFIPISSYWSVSSTLIGYLRPNMSYLFTGSPRWHPRTSAWCFIDQCSNCTSKINKEVFAWKKTSQTVTCGCDDSEDLEKTSWWENLSKGLSVTLLLCDWQISINYQRVTKKPTPFRDFKIPWRNSSKNILLSAYKVDSPSFRF